MMQCRVLNTQFNLPCDCWYFDRPIIVEGNIWFVAIAGNDYYLVIYNRGSETLSTVDIPFDLPQEDYTYSADGENILVVAHSVLEPDKSKVCRYNTVTNKWLEINNNILHQCYIKTMSFCLPVKDMVINFGVENYDYLEYNIKSRTLTNYTMQEMIQSVIRDIIYDPFHDIWIILDEIIGCATMEIRTIHFINNIVQIDVNNAFSSFAIPSGISYFDEGQTVVYDGYFIHFAHSGTSNKIDGIFVVDLFQQNSKILDQIQMPKGVESKAILINDQNNVGMTKFVISEFAKSISSSLQIPSEIQSLICTFHGDMLYDKSIHLFALQSHTSLLLGVVINQFIQEIGYPHNV
eukprot:210866_1